ncbi:hypothetical protein [Streptomyces sp. WMMC1477]|uniref:hypothetical protein n=1 Tax=Streptomyces sp. WMMC1477 TaxID=3015155 RepID=UPI0022B6B1FD|nr:hypothetical protein [Streptomyces sp. WMMC1477]MCZ7430820.1 hypothetical protein [Streptomyces sp. WMMC1477]
MVNGSRTPLARRYDTAVPDLDVVVHVAPDAVDHAVDSPGRARAVGLRPGQPAAWADIAASAQAAAADGRRRPLPAAHVTHVTCCFCQQSESCPAQVTESRPTDRSTP